MRSSPTGVPFKIVVREDVDGTWCVTRDDLPADEVLEDRLTREAARQIADEERAILQRVCLLADLADFLGRGERGDMGRVRVRKRSRLRDLEPVIVAAVSVRTQLRTRHCQHA